MAYGFNNDKSKNEDVVTLPDYSYESKDSQYNFEMTLGYYSSYVDYEDITKKGWYLFYVDLTLKTNLNVLVSVGTTEYEYSNANTNKFYHLVSESGSGDKLVKYKFFLPLDVGDRVGISRGSTGSSADIVALDATYIPIK